MNKRFKGWKGLSVGSPTPTKKELNKKKAELIALADEYRRKAFYEKLRQNDLPLPKSEYLFSERKFRADYAWPELKIILEVEGGIWTQGRHTRGAGFLKDMEKYNLAGLLGYRVFRCQPKELCSVKIIKLLTQVLR